ncbi:hypothetical protein COF36_24515, partial [Bacillus pseudomycoides]
SVFAPEPFKVFFTKLIIGIFRDKKQISSLIFLIHIIFKNKHLKNCHLLYNGIKPYTRWFPRFA